EQRLALNQERLAVRDPQAKPQRWKVPVAFGRAGALRASDTVLLDGSAELAVGRCGEAVKLNLGDVGYYRVRYDAPTQMALARSLPAMPPVDRLNLLADAWALTEAGRGPPSDYLELVDRLAGDSHRNVAEQVVPTFGRIDQLQRGRPGRPAFRAYARSILRPVFDSLGWDAIAGEGEANDRALLRTRLVRMLGDLGDEAVIAEARRRFDAFVEDPASL